MSGRLGFLEFEIPMLEAKLKALKQERKKLRASRQLSEQWKDPAFREMQARSGNGKAGHGALMRYNETVRLPWPKGSKPHNKYAWLRLKGWTRQEAIHKVNGGVA